MTLSLPLAANALASSAKSPLLALAVLASVVIAPGAAQAGHTAVVDAGASIQASVDAAAPGDTIIVHGTHRENVAIVKDRLTLRGIGAVIVPPVTPAAHACFDPTQPGEAVHGICVSGDVDVNTGAISRYVRSVTVSGFTVRGFTGSGINLTGARDATVSGNVAEGNVESGIAATASPGTRMLFNRASGTDRAALFVFRSPATTLIGNEARDSRFGIQIGDTLGGKVVANSVHDNCVGMIQIADAPGPVGRFDIAGNRVHHNSKACGANDDSPAVSGTGLALLGATGNRIVGNLIADNAPSGESAVSGGVAVTEGPAGTPSTDNVVKDNTLRGNAPDIFWDQTGTGNVFRPNRCGSSSPPSLC